MKLAAQRDLCLSSWSSSKKVTAAFLCYILLSSALLIRVGATRTCTRIEGSYRDCLCGVMYRDVEKHCQDEDTYYLPELSQQNLSCPFTCLNGGISYQNSCLCNADPGAQPSHGLCCEVRKLLAIYIIILCMLFIIARMPMQLVHACMHWEVTWYLLFPSMWFVNMS